MGILEMFGRMEQPDTVPVINMDGGLLREMQNSSIRSYGNDPYYMIGRRPLDIKSAIDNISKRGENTIGKILSSGTSGTGSDLDWNHHQFIGSDGISNFGFGDKGMMTEDEQKLKEYTFDIDKYKDTKFDKDLIDRAKSVYADMAKNNPEMLKYKLTKNNCQHYVDAVLSIARELAGDRGWKPDILEEMTVSD